MLRPGACPSRLPWLGLLRRGRGSDLPIARLSRPVLAHLLVVAIGAPLVSQPLDTRGPTVRVIDLVANDLLRGERATTVGVADALLADRITSGTRRIELLVDGSPFGRVEWPVDRERMTWNTRHLQDGLRNVGALAVDVAGNETSATTLRVRIDNTTPTLTKITSPSEVTLPAKGSPPDTTSPWAILTGPGLDQPVRGRARVEAFAVDDAAGSGIRRVAFRRGGTALGNGALTGSRYRLEGDTTTIGDGPQSLTAVATDRAGNSFTSAPISVVVDNAAPRIDRVRASPPVLRTGTVTVYVFFDEDVGMDESVAPTVRLRLPGGGTRAIGRQQYYGERGLWIGTVAVNRAADGAGAGVISVRDARDRAGNTMAAVVRAGSLQLVARNPAPPIAGNTIMNNLGVSYSFGGPTFRVHEGVDYQAAAGTRVNAVRAGRVQYAAGGGGSDRTIAVRVQVGETAGGASIFERDVYLHLENLIAVGTVVDVGDRIGDVGNNYAAGFNHTHHYWGPTINGSGYPRPRRNPLFNFLAGGDRDPQQQDPGLREGGGDGRTVYLRRRADGTLLATPANPVYGQLRIQGEFADRMNYYARSYPLEVGYWIEPRETLGQGVRSARAPYLLSHWYEYDIGLDNGGDFDRYVTRNPNTTWRTGGTAFNWTRYHHAWLSNAAALDGADGNRQAGQFWHAGARRGSGLRANGSDGAAARATAESRFRDGRYWVHLVSSDLRLPLRDAESSNAATWSPRHYNVGRASSAVVDNFAPHLFRVSAKQGTDRLRLRYDAGWRFSGGAQRLEPIRQEERNPRWVNGNDDLVVLASFSEPLRAAPTLILRRQGGIKRVTMSAGPASHNGAWTATIARTDPDLAEHRLDLAAGRRLAFAARDLAGNRIDTNPATIAIRNAATGAYAGHDTAADGDFGGAVVDKSYRVRVDTKHDRKAVPSRQLEAGS